MARLSGVLACLLLAGFVAPSPSSAHTRERDRIAAFEATQEKRNAMLTQGARDALDATARLDEAIKERRENATYLSRQIEALRSDMTSGLGSVVGSLTTALSKPLEELEVRFNAALKIQEEKAREELWARIAAEEVQRSQAIQGIEVQLNTLDGARKQEAKARILHTETSRTELDELRTSLKGFRSYLKQFNTALEARYTAMELRIGDLGKDLEALRKRQIQDGKESAQRMETLLQVVNEENLKLRSGLKKLAGGPKARPAVHIVQKGESLYGIARLYGVDLKLLETANPKLSKPGAMVHPGSKVKIPKG